MTIFIIIYLLVGLYYTYNIIKVMRKDNAFEEVFDDIMSIDNWWKYPAVTIVSIIIFIIFAVLTALWPAAVYVNYHLVMQNKKEMSDNLNKMFDKLKNNKNETF